MKKLLVLLVVLACCQIAHAEGLTTWLFGGVDYDSPNNEIETWLGYEKGPIEVGMWAAWRVDQQPQTYGFYGLYKFENLVEIPQFLPLPWLPEKLSASPCIGGMISMPGEEYLAAPFAGVVIQDILAIKYIYQDWEDDTSQVYFGLRYAF